MTEDPTTAFLDSPNRVILEVEPTQRIGFDGTKQNAATTAWIEATEETATG